MNISADANKAPTGVKLVKKTGIFGFLPVGTIFQGKAPAGMNSDEARIRAYMMLGREHPDENPMEWEVEL